MKLKNLFIAFFSTLPLVSAACTPVVNGDGNGQGHGLPQCGSASYVAFDSANHENQDLRVQAYEDMIALMNAAKEDPSQAAANFAEARDLYVNTASLQEKVQGRNDDHLEGQPNIGADMDAVILAALANGEGAANALEVNLAKQAVDKTMIEFFFLSVFHEMVLGAAEKWDEAYGYFGSGENNSEADAEGLAKVALKRDGDNGTTLKDEIFYGLVDGSCALAGALKEDGPQVDVFAVDAIKDQVELTDLAMQKVLAFSVGHEAFDMVDLQAQLVVDENDQDARDSMLVKLAELEPYFIPLERLMIARGGDSQTRANTIREEIDAALSDDTEAWMDSFDADGVLSAVEAEYGIDVVK
jgi:hypothetical protein